MQPVTAHHWSFLKNWIDGIVGWQFCPFSVTSASTELRLPAASDQSIPVRRDGPHEPQLFIANAFCVAPERSGRLARVPVGPQRRPRHSSLQQEQREAMSKQGGMFWILAFIGAGLILHRTCPNPNLAQMRKENLRCRVLPIP